MKLGTFRFSRPHDLVIAQKPKLSVGIVIACRDGQDKLNLVLASLSVQSYPSKLINVYIIDDGSAKPLIIPKIRPKNTKLISYKNSEGKWGKTAATSDVVSQIKSDVLWFIDADMVFEPDHLAHHMKWHHDADDYVVLGWKRFVKDWQYTPEQLVQTLNANGFSDLHKESWGKELWEARVSLTNDLEKPGIDGYRAFVGATFSMKNSQWKNLGGYNRNLVTGEDTELGWRVFVNGLRTVVDRKALSWHLGYSTVEVHKNQIQRHNDPTFAQLIPQMYRIREKSKFDWLVPTYQVFVDARETTLTQILSLREKLLATPGSTAKFVLLAPWAVLNRRYTPVSDLYSDLREIKNWLAQDPQFTLEVIPADQLISIEWILEEFKVGSTPYYIFADANTSINLKELAEYLLESEQGLVGVVDKKDQRAFAVFAPAIARATKFQGSVYQNISELWGIQWLNDDQFMKLQRGKNTLIKHFFNFLKREGKKINSPRQLLIFLKTLFTLIARELFRRG
jgi:GT2 family glycosyltransferase